MSATTMTITPTGGRFILVLLLLVIAFASVAGVGLAVSHGIEKHGQYAAAVHSCINRGGTIQQWHNPDTGRFARVCQIGPELFGIQIIDQIDGQWEEITAFIKRKMTRLEQVERYMRNTGYQIMH